MNIKAVTKSFLSHLGVFLIFYMIKIPLVVAGLTDETQTFPIISGGQIRKSLEEQVGAGHGDVNTQSSAVYLIKRDPARAIRRGRQLFQRKFTMNQGFGPRISSDSSGNIQNNRALGAGLSDSCSGCHGRPRGSAGFGGEVVTRPDSRDSPHLFGLGLLEMLADEITTDLRKIKAKAINKAEKKGKKVTSKLISKTINYGAITAFPDGTIDTSALKGVDNDLRIRPFFAHGGTISMREFIVGAFKAEMGLESPDSVLCKVTDPDNPGIVISPAGFKFDPATDSFERPPVCSIDEDGDNDSVINEIDSAVIDHMEFYLLNYFKPAQGERTWGARIGLRIMKRIGCTRCHKQNLTVEKDRRIADVETNYNSQEGVFNHLFATASLLVNEVSDDDLYPLLLPKNNHFVVENIFTDFKRHDLGPYLHEREYDGSMVTKFMTRPLWGVGSTSPYGHDGRSINLKEIILRHGGEAKTSRDKFARLHRWSQQSIIEFLNSLILFPPDDTASNLNPGNPDTDYPQDPNEHGSINLGALFTIVDEGDE